MTFVNPALLIGLGLAAIPLVIWLLNRQRFKTVRWAAMEFLLRAVKKHHRRLLLENLLLLIIRILIVILLALALARPEAAVPQAIAGLARAPRNVVFVIDASYSMGYQVGAGTVYERAVRFASEMAAHGLEPTDRVAIATADRSVRLLTPEAVAAEPVAVSRAVSDLQETSPSPFGTDASILLDAVARAAQRFERPGEAAGETKAPLHVTAYILTDMQKSVWVRGEGRSREYVERAKALAARGVRLVLCDCGVEEASNVTVVSLRAEDELVGTGLPVRFDAVLRASGVRGSGDVIVTSSADGQRGEDRPISLAPGEERTVSFHHSFFDRGTHGVSVSVATDPLAIDNARHLALEVRDRVDVLLVDGEPSSEWGEGETDSLSVAIRPEGEGAGPGVLRPSVATEATIPDDLSAYGAICLANVAVLSDEQLARLEGFVAGGGGLLVACGDQIDPEFYRRRLFRDGAGLLPAAVGSVKAFPEESAVHLVPRDLAHPALRFFEAKEVRAGLSQGRVEKFRRLEPRNGAALLATFDDPEGSPAIVEGAFGRGTVLLLATSVDAEWNNLYSRWSYPVLMNRLVSHLAGAAEGRHTIGVGEPYERILGASEYVARLTVVAPGGETTSTTLSRLTTGGKEERFLLSFADTARPGVYEVHLGTEEAARADAFAVNCEPSEGDATRIARDELRESFGATEVEVTDYSERGRLATSAAAKRDAVEFWPYLAGAALLLLALETMLAQRFGKG